MTEAAVRSEEEVKAMGFRWAVRTMLRLPNGSSITISPNYSLDSRLRDGATERERKAARFYNVKGAALPDELSELQIEEQLGEQ